jgi:hypothetical protein
VRRAAVTLGARQKDHFSANVPSTSASLGGSEATDSGVFRQRYEEIREMPKFEIPRYNASKEMIEAIRSALSLTIDRTGFSWGEIAQKMGDISKSRFLGDKLRNFRDGETKRPSDHTVFLPKLIEVLFEIAPDIINGELAKLDAVKPTTIANPTVIALAQALDLDLTGGSAALNQLQGTHCLYRRSHVNRTHIMKMRLVCGTEDDPAVFKLYGKFRGPTGTYIDDLITGTIVPFGTGYILIGRLAQKKSLYVLTIDRIWDSNGRPDEIKGTALVSVAGSVGTTYPFWGIYGVDDFDPECLSEAEAQDMLPSWEDTVVPSLNRGAITWRE